MLLLRGTVQPLCIRSSSQRSGNGRACCRNRRTVCRACRRQRAPMRWQRSSRNRPAQQGSQGGQRGREDAPCRNDAPLTATCQGQLDHRPVITLPLPHQSNIAADYSHVGECVISQSIDSGIALSVMHRRPFLGLVFRSLGSACGGSSPRLWSNGRRGQVIGHRSADLDAWHTIGKSKLSNNRPYATRDGSTMSSPAATHIPVQG